MVPSPVIHVEETDYLYSEALRNENSNASLESRELRKDETTRNLVPSDIN